MENIHLKAAMGEYMTTFAVTGAKATKKNGKYTSQSDHRKVY